MITFNSKSQPSHYQFFMRGELKADEEIQLISLRNEASYDALDNPQSYIVSFLANCFRATCSKVSFLWSPERMAKSTALRSKKFSLQTKRIFSSYRRVQHEIFVDEIQSMLICEVDLQDFTEASLPYEVLHSKTGLFILSPLNRFIEINKTLLPKEYSSSVFDVRGLLDQVRHDNDFCIIRYFPPENGRVESLVLIGKRNSLLMHRFIKCVVELSESL